MTVSPGLLVDSSWVSRNSTGPVVFGICFLATLCYVAYYKILHPLAGIPGPFFGSLTRLWLLRTLWRWDLHLTIGKLHEKYGSVVRVDRNEVWISDPTLLQAIYGAGCGFTKSQAYRVAGSVRTSDEEDKLDLLTEYNLERYRLQRRLVGPTYSAANVKKFEPLMNAKIQHFMSKMKDLEGKTLDLEEWMMSLVLDSMMYTTFSQDMGLLELGNSSGVTKRSEQMWRYFALAGLFPRIHYYRHYYTITKIKVESTIRKALRLKAKDREAPFPWNKALQVRAQRHNDYSSGTHQHDQMEDLLALQDRKPEWKDIYTDNMSLTNLGAGHDTITWSLMTTIYEICHSPGYQTLIHREIDDAIATGSYDTTSVASYEQSLKLTHLTNAIHESLRLHPVFSQPLPRIVPKSGLTANGHFLPPGTTVGISPLLLQTSRSVFGDDAITFNPDRWTNVSSKQKLSEMNTATLVWGGANRSCPGQYLAKQFMAKFLAELFARWEVRVLEEFEGEKGHMEKMRWESHFIMGLSGVGFRLKERERKG